jgi:heparinase II/III-like protein
MSARTNALVAICRGRPRLMATKPAIDKTRKLIEQNPTVRSWQQAIVRLAELMLTLPPLTPDASLDPDETEQAPLPLVRSAESSGGVATLLDIARRFSLRMQTLGLLWLITQDPRYRDRAKAELLQICGFTDWAGSEFLVTAEFAFGAAIGFDWLYDALDTEERRRVADAIVHKAIEPGLRELDRSPPLPQRWTLRPTNWSLVCSGALMIAAMSVAEYDDRAAQLFAGCRRAVRAGFDGYGPDGAWAEGPGYWHYATQYAIYLLDSLDTAIGDDLGLDASIGLSQTGLFRLYAAGPSKKLFNFADSEERHSGGYWLFWLARRYKHPVDAWTEQHRGKVHPMDLLWYAEFDRNPRQLPLARHFRGTEVAMLLGGWDPTDSYLGIKAGENDFCRHSHFDLGSFVFDALEVRWAIDLGPDNYNLPGYFDPVMKMQYYRTSTIGHNTLLLNGACQPPTADATITRWRFRQRLAVAVVDLSEAYPMAARVLRGFALIAEEHVLIVDEIVPDQPLASIDWQMHTTAAVELAGLSATMSHKAPQEGADPVRCRLQVIEAAGGSLSLEPATPSGPSGQDQNEGVGKLVLHLERVAGPVRLVVLLSPVGGKGPPRLPLALRQPLSEWARPRRNRAASAGLTGSCAQAG